MKNKIILCGLDGRPSMKKVHQLMSNYDSQLLIRRKNKQQSYIRYAYFNNDVVPNCITPKKTTAPTLENSVVIRWGNQIQLPTDNHTVVYNRSEAVAKASNKYRSRELFVEHGVRCPKSFLSENSQHATVFKDNSQLTYPLIARPIHHSKGKNFKVINSFEEYIDFAIVVMESEPYQEWYYSEFISKDKEYRVHVGSSKILAIMEKPNPESGDIAWNKALHGLPFKRVLQKDYNLEVCHEAIKACNALGLDFGGVDVIIKDGVPYVLECNTAPTLNSSDYVSKRYAYYFNWLFASGTRQPNWDFMKFTKGQSLAWKDAQFCDTNCTLNLNIDEEV